MAICLWFYVKKQNGCKKVQFMVIIWKENIDVDFTISKEDMEILKSFREL